MAIMEDANCHVAALHSVTMADHEVWEGEVLECIRYPVRDEAGDTPLSSMAGNRVKIFVCPARSSALSITSNRSNADSPSRIAFSKRRLCLLHLPRKVGFLDDGHIEPNHFVLASIEKFDKIDLHFELDGHRRLFILSPHPRPQSVTTCCPYLWISAWCR
jgi:hypothetical protein